MAITSNPFSVHTSHTQTQPSTTNHTIFIVYKMLNFDSNFTRKSICFVSIKKMKTTTTTKKKESNLLVGKLGIRYSRGIDRDNSRDSLLSTVSTNGKCEKGKKRINIKTINESLSRHGAPHHMCRGRVGGQMFYKRINVRVCLSI